VKYIATHSLSFSFSNKAAYVNCEIYNRTLVKDCSELAGTSLIDGTVEQLTMVVDATCQESDGE